MMAGYGHFSGVARLNRLGATVEAASSKPAKDRYGEWSLVPSTLRLLAIHVPQCSATGSDGGSELEAYRKFVNGNRPGYTAEWNYGGGMLLFYRAGNARPVDGETEIDGLTCRVYRRDSLGVHALDLYKLADVIERGRSCRRSNGREIKAQSLLVELAK